MKYAAPQMLALAGLGCAFPHPQFSLPFSMPSFSLPTGGFGSGTGTGSGSGLGGLLGGGGLSIPSLPAATGLPSLGGGLSGGGLSGGGLSGGGLSGGGLGGGLSGGGLSGGGLSGGGLSIPSLPAATGLPSLGGGLSGGGLGSGLGGLSGGGLGGGLLGGLGSTKVQVTATGTAIANATGGATPTVSGGVSQPTATTPATGGSGTVGANCTPQGSSGGLGGTENGVTDKNCCTDLTVIFARGTGEMGNVGTVSGPPMFKALRTKLGNNRVTVQGVDYAASAAGNAAMGGDGGQVMAKLVQTALSQCPSTKIVLSGYSQGGMVVHNAFSKGVKSSQVAGAVLFGDPMKRSAVGDLSTDKVQQFCGTSDFVCGGGGEGGATGSHISYGSVADKAADFAIKAAGLTV